jgi:hypothetical protein
VRLEDTLPPVPDAAEAESVAGPRGWPAGVGGAIRRRLTLEHLLALLLGLLVLAVHDVPYILTTSYWNDESWVAVTTRFPLSQLRAVVDSTPIGFAAVLRVINVPGTESGRLMPLAFAGAAVVIAYWFARQLGWRQREAAIAAGALAGIGALLVPSMLIRNDLKQYTADACLSLLVLALTSRLEREWSRPRLVALSVAVWGGMFFSDAVAFIGVGAFAALCLVELARRAWRRLAEAACVGAITAVLMVVVYKAFYAAAVTEGLVYSPHFRFYYLPLRQGLNASLTFITASFSAVHSVFGLGPVWLALPLFVAGVLTVLWLDRPATAIALAALYPEMMAISAVHKYPFLDMRTSTFLFTITAVTAAIGVVGICAALRPVLKGWTGAVAIAAALVAAGGFYLHNASYVRIHSIPAEDEKTQTLYVAGHTGPNDVILVNLSSNWGFAYYWPHGQPARRKDPYVAQEYEAYFPGQPRIVVAFNRSDSAVAAALAQAVAQSKKRSCSPIWLIRTHVSSQEYGAWHAALQKEGLTARPVGVKELRMIQVRGTLQCR